MIPEEITRLIEQGRQEYQKRIAEQSQIRAEEDNRFEESWKVYRELVSAQLPEALRPYMEEWPNGEHYGTPPKELAADVVEIHVPGLAPIAAKVWGNGRPQTYAMASPVIDEDDGEIYFVWGTPFGAYGVFGDYFQALFRAAEIQGEAEAALQEWQQRRLEQDQERELQELVSRPRYMMVKECEIATLEETIAELLENDWQLHGPTQICRRHGEVMFYQALVLNTQPAA